MKNELFRIATMNLYNLNLPGKPIYTDPDGWTTTEYERKVSWFSDKIAYLQADIIGFQELWHTDALMAVLDDAYIRDSYDVLSPEKTSGTKIVCAGIVKKGLLIGKPEWIDRFPDGFILQGGGDDSQTPAIAVTINGFSRPILHFICKPIQKGPEIHVYVCHFKSKAPAKVYTEDWYKENSNIYKRHATCLGSALSTIRRTAEAAALRYLLTEQLKNTDTPVIVVGDINDSTYSNTANILTEQPTYLFGDALGGNDSCLYSSQTLQEYRDTRDVIYTHVHKGMKESLDQIFVSQEFYDHSKKRQFLFQDLVVLNDHLSTENHKEDGSTDHGILCASFQYKPIK